MPRFVDSNPNQQFLLPPDMREWIPADDIVHFVLGAVERLPLPYFKADMRGGGSDQYNPRTMLALLIYCLISDIRSSREMERATYRDVGARVLTGDTHPDHDTIRDFRRDNEEAVKRAFVELLLLAKTMGFLKVGVVSVGGATTRANAGKRRGTRHDRALELRGELEAKVDELLEKAEAEDRADKPDDQKLPERLMGAKNLGRELDKAARRIERREKKERAKRRKAPAGGN